MNSQKKTPEQGEEHQGVGICKIKRLKIRCEAVPKKSGD